MTETKEVCLKLKPRQLRWLRDIGGATDGRLAFHAHHKSDLNALQAILDGGLIRIRTAFEGGLFSTEITESGRAHLKATEAANGK